MFIFSVVGHHKGLKCDGSSLTVNQARDPNVECLVLGKEWEDVGKCEAASRRQGTWSTRQGTKAGVWVMMTTIRITTVAPSKPQNIYP